MMTHKQIQQMFSEESGDDEFWGFESILVILVRLICGFDSVGGLLVLKTGASYTQELLIHMYIYSIYTWNVELSFSICGAVCDPLV